MYYVHKLSPLVKNKESFIIQPRFQVVRFEARSVFDPKAQLGLARYQDLLSVGPQVICERFVPLLPVQTAMVDNSWTNYALVNCNTDPSAPGNGEGILTSISVI